MKLHQLLPVKPFLLFGNNVEVNLPFWLVL